MRILVLICFAVVFFACNQSSTSSSSGINLDAFELKKIEGDGLNLAIKRNTQGKIIEQGIIRDGVKDGLWITYHDDDNGLPARIISYASGIQNGPDLKFSNRGQIEEMSNYFNNQLDGLYGKYRFGRPTMTTEYATGQLDGAHTEYFNNGKPQKLIEFKDGKQDGLLRYYDEEGNITLEYQYENGEKVSGGIVK
jgi:antitoxin component YwqK of YwqJK toxin-antitoxin module